MARVVLRCGTSLAFIGCHLAAHEGKQYREARNAQCRQILEGSRITGIGGCCSDADVSLQSSHAFFFGDLNYRVAVGGAEATHEERFAAASRLMTEGDEGLTQLYAGDELEAALAREALVGFFTAPPTFPPTFKVVKGVPASPSAYSRKRIPSWCDRVLWRSMPGLALELTEYASALEACAPAARRCSRWADGGSRR